MDMITSMTMPEYFIAGLIVLAVVGLGLYLVVRVAGERQVDADRGRERVPRRRRREVRADPGDPKV